MKKTYLEAIEYVLDTELDARGDLICFRPGARRTFGEAERDVALPRMGSQSFSVALGAALQGMHPVLDLMQESGAADMLKAAVLALPADASPAITILACAQDGMKDLPGVYVFEPETPRQAAGFMRSALKMNRMTLLLADQALFAEEDEIPEDRGFTLLPLTEEETADEADEETAAPEETEEEAALPEEEEPAALKPDEEAAYDAAEAEEPAAEAADEEAASEEAEEPAPMIPDGEAAQEQPAAEEEAQPVKKEYAFIASRQTGCDLTALRALCALLEMDEETLIERCAGHVLPVCGGFELHAETDAPEGEAAFIPPEEEAASLWLGGDMLTVSYDPDRMAHADAAKLLRAVKRVFEKPQLLIYDKEYDG